MKNNYEKKGREGGREAGREGGRGGREGGSVKQGWESEGTDKGFREVAK